MDTLSKKDRADLMSRVRSADTKPEWILRCGLHRMGFRYRLTNRTLPGRPDLVLPKHNAALFVHGCYWHQHPGCKGATIPRTNTAFWKAKFDDNRRRDARVRRQLEADGWRVRVVWECELEARTVETVEAVASWLRCDSGDNGADTGVYRLPERRELLAIAEEKVRYRVSRYGDNTAPACRDRQVGKLVGEER